VILKKSALIAIVSLLAGIIILSAFFFLKSDNLESAINEYENGNYFSAITDLNNLRENASYEDGEKIYYYRCRAINDLAQELEEKYSKYLKTASAENRGTEDYEKAKKKIEDKLESVNNKTGGDLHFVEAPGMSRIIQGGKFYNEFLSNYRGSSFIEDLDFNELTRGLKAEPDKLLHFASAFYSKYPDSSYIPKIVSMIFDSMLLGKTAEPINDSRISNMIINFAARYPTSQEASRIYVSAGDNVNLRDSPGLNGNPSGKTVQDEVLIQLEKSMDTMQIGDSRDYWYRVATLRGVQGWIFGKFLKPLDPGFVSTASSEENWTIHDTFDSWSDSNTPENWMHVPGAEKKYITFRKEGNKKILLLNAEEISSAGLYSRFSRIKEFRLMIKARFISGSPVAAAAFSQGQNSIYSLTIGEGSININGRIIPFNTGNWHVYEIFSENPNFVSLSIDGEIISGRIPPANDERFNQPGTYLLYSDPGKTSECEVEFIKIK
jgi:hypothetical protein